MRNVDDRTITPAVIAQLASCDNPRLKQIMVALVAHLHDFARVAALTATEWKLGIEFLTAIGQMCDEQRQEFSVDVWQADDDGLYDVQRPELGATPRAGGMLRSDTNGAVRFRTVAPTTYPVLSDGPVGYMLAGTGAVLGTRRAFTARSAGRVARITHIFSARNPYFDSDMVFGVRASPIGDYVGYKAGTAPDATMAGEPLYSLSATTSCPCVRLEMDTMHLAA